MSPLADRHLLPLVAQADLILCVGYDPIEMRTGWRDAWTPARQRVIDITAVPNHHYMHQAGMNLVAHCAPTLAALSEGVAPRATWPDGAPGETRAALARAFPRDDDWGPAAVIDECRRSLPRDALATADSGAHRILLSQMWECYEPRGLMQSSALCTMGCAVPLAMGAGLAAPGRVVVSFSGDAGFLMVAGELATAAELGLRTIFVVFVDASLALIEMKQRQRQLPTAGWISGSTIFGASAGLSAATAIPFARRPELAAAIRDGLKADRFTVIGCLIDRRAYDGRFDPARPGCLDGIAFSICPGCWPGRRRPSCLGDLGADVIKVEHPVGGDDTRGWGPPFLVDRDGRETRESAYFLCTNRNKRSVAVDIATAEGQAIVRDLAAVSDVVAENFKVGGLAKYGLDYADLAKVNPRLVYCSVTGFGQTGPYEDRAGYDFIAQGLGGIMSITGEPDGRPMKVGVGIADVMCGMYAAVGILAALRHRDATGRGQHIDIVAARLPGRLADQRRR